MCLVRIWNFGIVELLHLCSLISMRRTSLLKNSAGPVGQAVACFVSADRAFFKNCRFLGYQDTLYTYGKHSRQYYEDCYIEGTVDFIFGWSVLYSIVVIFIANVMVM